MNYLPFCGYWFYGATTSAQRASLFCSFGLLFAAPVTGFVLSRLVLYYKRLRER